MLHALELYRKMTVADPEPIETCSPSQLRKLLLVSSQISMVSSFEQFVRKSTVRRYVVYFDQPTPHHTTPTSPCAPTTARQNPNLESQIHSIGCTHLVVSIGLFCFYFVSFLHRVLYVVCALSFDQHGECGRRIPLSWRKLTL